MVPMLLRVPEVAEMLSISRSKAYEMIKRGALPSVNIGGSVRVPRELLEQMVREETRPWLAETTK